MSHLKKFPARFLFKQLRLLGFQLLPLLFRVTLINILGEGAPSGEVLMICKCHFALLALSFQGEVFFCLIPIFPPPSNCLGVKLMVGHIFCLKHLHDSSLPVQWWVNLPGHEGTCVRAEHRRAALSVRSLWLVRVSPYQKKEHVTGLSLLQVPHSLDDKLQGNGDEIRNWQHAVRRD